MTNVIAPLVARHASDAAFYWMRLDQSVTTFHLTLAHYRLFNSRLDAHLEGLEVAGAEGVQPAFAALERWKKPGEAFVCTWLKCLKAQLDAHYKCANDLKTASGKGGDSGSF